MAARLVIAPEAERDIGEAYDWYEARTGLGEEFLGCVEACIEGIARMPGIHPPVHEHYCRSLVRRFPYANEDVSGTVTVYGVFHTSRDPDKWKKRLP